MRKRAKKSTPGPPCRVCASAKRETLENAIRRGSTTAEIANTYGLGRKSIRTHATKHMVPPVDIAEEREPVGAVMTKARPADASPLERARLNADEALEALQRGEKTNLPPKDLARMRDSLTNAEKFYAQLAGSRALTPEAIVKTEGWRLLIEEVAAALKPWPEASRAVLAAMRA